MRDEFLISSVGARRWLCAAAILLAELSGAISFDLEALSAARFPIRTVGGTTSRVERLSRSDPAEADREEEKGRTLLLPDGLPVI